MYGTVVEVVAFDNTAANHWQVAEFVSHEHRGLSGVTAYTVEPTTPIMRRLLQRVGYSHTNVGAAFVVSA
jgi:hypothetical protein